MALIVKYQITPNLLTCGRPQALPSAVQRCVTPSRGCSKTGGNAGSRGRSVLSGAGRVYLQCSGLHAGSELERGCAGLQSSECGSVPSCHAARDMRRQLGQCCALGHEEFSSERRSGLSNPSCWATHPHGERAFSDAEAQTPLQKLCDPCMGVQGDKVSTGLFGGAAPSIPVHSCTSWHLCSSPCILAVQCSHEPELQPRSAQSTHPPSHTPCSKHSFTRCKSSMSFQNALQADFRPRFHQAALYNIFYFPY